MSVSATGIQLFEQIAHGDGISTTFETKKTFKEFYDMSLCFCVKYGDTVYIASDSRSSYIQRNCFGGVSDSLIDSDDYQKIVNVNINGNNVVLISTGQNKFSSEQKSFSAIINELMLNSYNDIKEFIESVRKTFWNYKNPDTALEITVLVEKENNIYSYTFPNAVDENSIILLDKEHKKIEALWQGTRWAKCVFEYSRFDEEFENERRTIEQINKVYEKINRLSCEFDNTVGGLVRIGKLTPNGFSWLRNGYEL